MGVFGGTRNFDHHRIPHLYEKAQLEAGGFQWPDKGTPADAQPRFNGGIVSSFETRLQAGDKIYRFADSSRKLDDHIAGRWWFDQDTCVFLWSKSGPGARDAGFRNAARSAFAVLDEWGDMGNLVTGVLAFDFWALKGVTARAEGQGGQSMNNPHGVHVLQLFIPGGLARDSFSEVKRAALTRLRYG